MAAVVAVMFGHSARKSFTWVAAGTLFWCITVAVMAGFGRQVAGIGAPWGRPARW
jgi:hypothetical protein